MTRDPSGCDETDRVPVLLARSPANTNASPGAVEHPDMTGIAERLTDPPARTWGEAADKVRFLLERYAASPQAQDARIRKLIDRALGDMARLRRRLEDKT